MAKSAGLALGGNLDKPSGVSADLLDRAGGLLLQCRGGAPTVLCTQRAQTAGAATELLASSDP
jgi:hypothetical protein